jgi:hypothetical protein
MLVARFGDGGLVSGEWPVIGGLPNWDRSRWSFTRFLREDPCGTGYVVEYDDRNPSKVLSEIVAPEGIKSELPSNGAMGYRYLRDELVEKFAD